MLNKVKALLAAHGITEASPISLADVTLTRAYLLEKHGVTGGTAFMLAVPYYTTFCDDPARNISAYAVSRDYHRFFEALFADILPKLRAAYPENTFLGFADHSPIAEAEAAVKAGLGAFGKNHLFLSKKYGSYVFLGEIITDAVLEAPTAPVTLCADCGACLSACPAGLAVGECLSALSQKKGALTEDEEKIILANGCAWGCDRCQELCPVNKRARAEGTLYTDIPFFKEQAMPHLTADTVRAMSDEDFAARAYSWRGRAVILRNLDLLEATEKQENGDFTRKTTGEEQV